MRTRTEHDTMGAIDVPAERLWGAQTQRSLLNFNISGERMPREIIMALAQLHATLTKKAHDFNDIVKIGRTHLQDATPLTLGQEFSGYCAQLAHGQRHIGASLAHLCELALGGTAVGTGLNAPPGFAELAAAELARLTSLPLITAPNKFEALASCDGLVHAHGALKTLAASQSHENRQ